MNRIRYVGSWISAFGCGFIAANVQGIWSFVVIIIGCICFAALTPPLSEF